MRCRRSDEKPTSSGFPLGTLAAVSDKASRMTATRTRGRAMVTGAPFGGSRAHADYDLLRVIGKDRKREITEDRTPWEE